MGREEEGVGEGKEEEDVREIKFRAWDKEKKEMLSIENLWVDFAKLGQEHIDRKRNLHALRIRQYTGLKDKNGKEIYEGDVLEFVFITGSVGSLPGYTVTGEKCVIEFSKGKFVLCRINKDGDKELDDIKHYEWVLDNVFREEDREGIKVIGNIYENQELKEAKK